MGDDAYPCSRTAPCKTFAGAILNTAAGGEISVLDPGSYGAVTITKSLTGVLVNAGSVNVENSMLTSNGTGANAAGGTLRLSNNGIYDNGTGLGCGGGTVETTGDNRSAGNTSPGCAPVGGLIPVM